jgi:phosphotransferase system enzyme I (PtsP)
MTKLTAVKTVSPLALLRQVRDVLRAAEDAQVRLNKLVTVIAEGFSSEVCSIYFARPGQKLELFATVGLKQEAVHSTSLRIGEGLVGDIAQIAVPLNLPEARKHPKFAYRVETGEDAFHSFVGVPILYHHRVIGVLTVQSSDARIYSDEQVEILQTISMVLAELAIAAQVVEMRDITGEADGTAQPQYYSGLKLSPGLAKATAVLHRPKLEITNLVSDNPSYEEQRLQTAMTDVQQSIDTLIRDAGLAKDDAKLEIIETYRMFTHDQGWLNRIVEAIKTGLTAEAAVKKVEEQMHARMAQIDSTYIKERMQDLEDLSTRLLYHLAGAGMSAAHAELPGEFILVAKSIGPAELLEYANRPLKGVIVEEGSAASHVAIIARMMDIPMVGRIPHVTDSVQTGDLAIVDGEHGEVFIRPSSDVEQAIDEHIAQRQKLSAEYEAARDLAAVTLDEVKVSLNLNVGLFLDAKHLARPDVDGIGLYRTELPYLASSDIPDVDEQRKMYGAVFRHARGKPIIFRSFDIGGDKQVPYLDAGLEENPAMGWRATRVGLDRPVILRRQFRALIRAAGGHHLHIMFPFIATVSEFDETKAILDRELERAKVEGQTVLKSLKIGSMIEIPSLLYQLPQLLKRVDFVSIGSNDLLQFLFACDRGSERLSGRYDPLSPVFLNIIRHLVEQCKAAEVELGFCGAMASRPLEAMALIGCGVRNMSIPPPSIGPVKAMIRSLKYEALLANINYLLTLPDHSIRNQLEQFAHDEGVVLN